jgi:hypothetical protein
MIMTGYLGLWQIITTIKHSSASAWAAGICIVNIQSVMLTKSFHSHAGK